MKDYEHLLMKSLLIIMYVFVTKVCEHGNNCHDFIQISDLNKQSKLSILIALKGMVQIYHNVSEYFLIFL